MKHPWKWLTIILIVYPALLVISFALIFLVSLQYYKFIIGAKDYQSLYDWDYPANVEGDFNNDGKKDEITSGGCANFDKKTTLSKPLSCNPYYSDANVTQKDSRGAKYPYHSYMVKENGLWNILVLDQYLKLSRYEIQNNATIKKVPPNLIDVIRELIYAIPVLLFYMLFLPLAYLLTIFGRGIALVYLITLTTSGYLWRKSAKLPQSKTKKAFK